MSRGKLDISDDLTVFLITTGEETYGECLEALENQDCRFKTDYIRDVYPMSAAFQAMPDRCQTRYFVQLDADFVLERHVIRTLHESVRRSGFRRYRVHGQLYEEGWGVGASVKCWKRSIFRLFKFRDVRTVDRDFHARVSRWGFKRQAVPGILGLHKPRHSSFSTYLKAKSDVEKWRYLRRPVEDYALARLEQGLADFAANKGVVLGTLLGALSGQDLVSHSKNTILERDRYERVLELLGQDEEISQSNAISDVDTKAIREVFRHSYDQFGSSDGGPHARLSRLVLDMFGRRDRPLRAAEDLLELVSQ